MASQLQRRCLKDHKHQQLVGGRCANAAFYPKGLVRAILKGIGMQMEEDRIQRCSVNAMPMKSAGYSKADNEFGEVHFSFIPTTTGGKHPVRYEEQHFRIKYTDEYTGEHLPIKLIREAIEEELNYFSSKVWQMASKKEVEGNPNAIVVRSRWV